MYSCVLKLFHSLAANDKKDLELFMWDLQLISSQKLRATPETFPKTRCEATLLPQLLQRSEPSKQGMVMLGFKNVLI